MWNQVQGMQLTTIIDLTVPRLQPLPERSFQSTELIEAWIPSLFSAGF